MNLNCYVGFTGKTVSLTGATLGIGLAMSRVFVDAGAPLMFASNKAAACHALADALPSAIGVPTDVTDRRTWPR